MARKGVVTAGVSAGVAGGVGGAIIAEQGWLQTLVDAFVQVLDQHGLAAVVCLLFVFATLWALHKMLSNLIAGKDAEIARLVAERDRLYDQVLTKRQSSQGGGKKK